MLLEFVLDLAIDASLQNSLLYGWQVCLPSNYHRHVEVGIF
jgi:hypothetical protein